MPKYSAATKQIPSARKSITKNERSTQIYCPPKSCQRVGPGRYITTFAFLCDWYTSIRYVAFPADVSAYNQPSSMVTVLDLHRRKKNQLRDRFWGYCFVKSHVELFWWYSKESLEQTCISLYWRLVHHVLNEQFSCNTPNVWIKIYMGQYITTFDFLCDWYTSVYDFDVIHISYVLFSSQRRFFF